jgi:uncharacterized membrane protein
MTPWLSAALGAALFISVHYMFMRAASGGLPDTLGALILEGTATVGILLNFLVGPRGAQVATTSRGVWFSVASGLAISGASILMFAALRKGGPVTTTGTIVLGGGVTLSALVAPWLFGEGFTARRAIGVALGVAAMAVLAQDRNP